MVARFQGGPNAGHSLKINGQSFVLNTIPSGIFREHCKNLIGSGVVIDPAKLQIEIEKVKAAGAPVEKNLLIARKAHLILPTHIMLDAAQENAKGTAKIGSTLRGISLLIKIKLEELDCEWVIYMKRISIKISVACCQTYTND